MLARKQLRFPSLFAFSLIRQLKKQEMWRENELDEPFVNVLRSVAWALHQYCMNILSLLLFLLLLLILRQIIDETLCRYWRKCIHWTRGNQSNGPLLEFDPVSVKSSASTLKSCESMALVFYVRRRLQSIHCLSVWVFSSHTVTACYRAGSHVSLSKCHFCQCVCVCVCAQAASLCLFLGSTVNVCMISSMIMRL